MCPCNPNDVSVDIPDGPSGPAIPGFGTPFALKQPSLNPFPDGFPEDLLDLLNKLQLLIPPGALKPQLNPNFGKDVFDAIMKLLDQFMPFLMLYKFFLPILELIICIIEVLCALMNPFKLIRALNRLFSQCIPNFLNLFPIFALIIMIISLLLLILALILYIIEQILKFIKAILQNILALEKAFTDADQNSVLAIAKKLGSLLCIFQNLFVLFAIFNIIIQIIRDILSLIFSIPPCDDGDPSDSDNCCTPDVCPAIVKENYTRVTGRFKYLPRAAVATSLNIPFLGSAFNVDIRPESWQLYDFEQTAPQKFRNIFDAYDITTPVTFLNPKPIFFPTDGVYNAQTAPKQAPYTVDLRLFYNPASWGRSGTPRFIRFKDCILTKVPSVSLQQGNLSTLNVDNAVGLMAGGLGFEDDGTTVLFGFDDNNVQLPAQATLENFIHMKSQTSQNPVLNIDDGYQFIDMEYTFKPNIAPLLQKNLVTLGCVPSIALNRAFLNNIFAGDIGVKTKLLGDLLNGRGGPFPDPGACQECLTNAVNNLRVNMTAAGVAQFQAATDVCLKKLQDDTNSALGSMVGIGFDPCKSTFKVEPTTQFTTQPIVITVDLNERNGLSLTRGLSAEVGTNLAARLKAHVTFGKTDNFVYDGYQSFTSNLTSDTAGTGTISVSFDNQIFCTNTFPPVTNPPSGGDVLPVHALVNTPYKFIFSPSTGFVPQIPTGEGDTDGQPRRDAGDISRDRNGGGDGGV